MTNRAHDFINVARELNLTYEQILHVVDDAIDLDVYADGYLAAHASVAQPMNALLCDARKRFTSDDDYDDFKAEVRTELGFNDDYDLFNE